MLIILKFAHLHHWKATMKRNLLSALGAIAIFGCGAEPVALEKLPPTDPANAGEVLVIRPRAFIGEDMGYLVNAGNTDIAELRSRAHHRLTLAARDHRRAAPRCSSPSGWGH